MKSIKKQRNVQAFDSILGRWESAKLLEESEDGGSAKISFNGWGKQYDTIVEQSFIRDVVQPFDSEVGSISRRVRRQTPNEHVYLTLLRSLVSGEKVFVKGDDGGIEEGEVLEVDRFKRTVVVIFPDGKKKIHASHLCVPQEEDDITTKPKRRNCRKKKKVPTATLR